jgi:hypothetical protein
MFCPSCGKEISDKSAFCVFCGTHINPIGMEPEEEIAINRITRYCELLKALLAAGALLILLITSFILISNIFYSEVPFEVTLYSLLFIGLSVLLAFISLITFSKAIGFVKSDKQKMKSLVDLGVIASWASGISLLGGLGIYIGWANGVPLFSCLCNIL